MTPTRPLLALLVIQMLALGAAAQTDTAEFGRASGGAISAITKAPRQTSGSLGLTHSTGAFRGTGYEATLGGELLDDRLWFFGAASILPDVRLSTPDLTAYDLKATAQPVDWTTVTASFTQFSSNPTMNGGVLPPSFLSLRSTSILSDRMTLDFSFSQTK